MSSAHLRVVLDEVSRQEARPRAAAVPPLGLSNKALTDGPSGTFDGTQ